ncbi:hypothetical protein SAMN05216199_1585 [Pedococcus cremeus]|uniref:Uncharacterized protein n=1 Tax=Pedococcus cremeus TaxID=587636 RepID=A0A1H9TF80_9MICO|nr:hypothetical protein SAMN05216199_1585 [Pedococcus cremeus]
MQAKFRLGPPTPVGSGRTRAQVQRLPQVQRLLRHVPVPRLCRRVRSAKSATA